MRAIDDRYPYPEDLSAFGQLPTFGPLDRLLLDEQVADIHLNGPGREVLLRRGVAYGGGLAPCVVPLAGATVCAVR